MLQSNGFFRIDHTNSSFPEAKLDVILSLIFA